MVKHNNSLIKKTFAVVAVITAFVFFTFNTFAASPSVFNDYSASISSNGVQFLLRAVQFKSSSLGTSMLPGGMESVFYVTLEIRNSNTQAALVRNPMFNITISEDKTISHIYSYSSDLLLERQTWFKVVPSSEFSYSSNGSELIVVPPETSLYFVGEVCTTAQLDQTGQTIQDAGLRGVDFVENDFYVAKGDYPYGTAVDLSPVTTILSNLSSDVSDISTAISDIVDAITYSGTGYSVNNPNTVYTNVIGNTTPVTGMLYNLKRIVMTPYYVSNDIELDNTNDVIVHTGTKCTEVIYTLFFRNTDSEQRNFRIWASTQLTDFLPVGLNYSFDYELISDVYSGFRVDNRTNQYLICKNVIGSYGYVNPGDHYTYLKLKIYHDEDVTITFNNTSLNFQSYSFVNEYHPSSEYMILRDLYLAYSQVNGLDDSSDLSNDVADVSDSNHIIEESYYSANASAIQATGLSNYHFTNEQNNGISAVSNDFMLLWNALGSWNGVYIFSLTMALATFIMRHGGLFTIKRKVSDKGGEE